LCLLCLQKLELDPYLGRRLSHHCSKALLSIVKIQLRIQGPHDNDLKPDLTDRIPGVVRTRKAVRLARALIRSFIEIQRSKNWIFDLDMISS
jgi:hypothetical protein